MTVAVGSGLSVLTASHTVFPADTAVWFQHKEHGADGLAGLREFHRSFLLQFAFGFLQRVELGMDTIHGVTVAILDVLHRLMQLLPPLLHLIQFAGGLGVEFTRERIHPTHERIDFLMFAGNGGGPSLFQQVLLLCGKGVGLGLDERGAFHQPPFAEQALTARVLPKLPSAVESTPKTAQDVGQETGPVAEKRWTGRIWSHYVRKTVGDGRRPKANGEIPDIDKISRFSLDILKNGVIIATIEHRHALGPSSREKEYEVHYIMEYNMKRNSIYTTWKMTSLMRCRAFGLAIAMGSLSFFSVSAVRAVQPLSYQISRSGFFTQNSTAAPVTADYYEWGVDVDQNPSAFDSGTITYPLSQSVNLNVSPTFMSAGAIEGSLSSLNTNYPTGAYTLTVHDSTNTNPDEALTANYNQDAYTNVPAVTGATYSALAGLDPSQPFTVNFSPLAVNGAAASFSGGILLSIYDASNNYVVDTFPASSAISYLIPANTLSPTTAYTLFINFSDGIYDSSADGNIIQSFQTGTSVPFTTGSVPEPASLVLFGVGAAIMLIRRKSVISPSSQAFQNP